MPYSRDQYLTAFRQQKPELNWSDNDILSYYQGEFDRVGTLKDHPALQQIAPATAEPAPATEDSFSSDEESPGIIETAKKGWDRGVDTAQAKLFGAEEWLGDTLGDNRVGRYLSEQGKAGYDRNMDEAKDSGEAPVQNFSQIGKNGGYLKDFTLWATNTVSEAAPQVIGGIAASLAAGAAIPEAAVGAGAVGITGALVRIGGWLLPKAVISGTAETAASGAALAVGRNIVNGLSSKMLANFAGEAAFNAVQSQNYRELKDQGGEDAGLMASINASVGSLIGSIAPTRLVNELGGVTSHEAQKGITKFIYDAVSKTPVLKPMALAASEAWEHGSEMFMGGIAQEGIVLATEAYSFRDQPDKVPDATTIRDRLLNAGVAGFMLGGMSGVGMSVLQGDRPEGKTGTVPSKKETSTQSVLQPEQPLTIGEAPPATKVTVPPARMDVPPAPLSEAKRVLLEQGVDPQIVEYLSEEQATSAVERVRQDATLADKLAAEERVRIVAEEQARVLAAQQVATPQTAEQLGHSVPVDSAAISRTAAEVGQASAQANKEATVEQSTKRAMVDAQRETLARVRNDGEEVPSPVKIRVAATPDPKAPAATPTPEAVVPSQERTPLVSETKRALIEEFKADPQKVSVLSESQAVNYLEHFRREAAMKSVPTPEVAAPTAVAAPTPTPEVAAPTAVAAPTPAPGVGAPTAAATPTPAPEVVAPTPAPEVVAPTTAVAPKKELSAMEKKAEGGIDSGTGIARPDFEGVPVVPAPDSVTGVLNPADIPDPTQWAGDPHTKDATTRTVIFKDEAGRVIEAPIYSSKTSKGRETRILIGGIDEGLYDQLATAYQEKFGKELNRNTASRYLKNLDGDRNSEVATFIRDTAAALGYKMPGRGKSVESISSKEFTRKYPAVYGIFEHTSPVGERARVITELPDKQKLPPLREQMPPVMRKQKNPAERTAAKTPESPSDLLDEATRNMFTRVDRNGKRVFSPTANGGFPEFGDAETLGKTLSLRRFKKFSAEFISNAIRSGDGELHVRGIINAVLELRNAEGVLEKLSPVHQAGLTAHVEGLLHELVDSLPEDATKSVGGVDTLEDALKKDIKGAVAHTVAAPDGGIHLTQAGSEKLYSDILSTGRAFNTTIILKDAIKDFGGAYDKSKNLVALGLRNALSPTVENLRMAFHEVTHPVVEALPKYARAALYHWVDSIFAEGNPLDPKVADPRVVKGDLPDGARLGMKSNEQAVEYLTMLGLSKPVATNAVATIWRGFKEVILKSALYVQKLFLGEKNTGGFLAAAFAENLAARIAGGDYAKVQGFPQSFGRAPTTAEVFHLVGGEARRVQLTDKGLRYEPIHEPIPGAVQFNITGPVQSLVDHVNSSGMLDRVVAENVARTLGADPLDELKAQVRHQISGAITRAKIEHAVASEVEKLIGTWHEKVLATSKDLTPEEKALRKQSAQGSYSNLGKLEEFRDALGLPNTEELKRVAKKSLDRVFELTGVLSPEEVETHTKTWFNSIDEIPEEGGLRDLALTAYKGHVDSLSRKLLKKGNQWEAEFAALNAEHGTRQQEIFARLNDVTNAKDTLVLLNRRLLSYLKGTEEQKNAARRLDIGGASFHSVFKELERLSEAGYLTGTYEEVIKSAAEFDQKRPYSSDSELGDLKKLSEKNPKLLSLFIKLREEEPYLADLIVSQTRTNKEETARFNLVRKVVFEPSETERGKIKAAIKDSRTIKKIALWEKELKKLRQTQDHMADLERKRPIVRDMNKIVADAQTRVEQRLKISVPSELLPGVKIPNLSDTNLRPDQVDVRSEKLPAHEIDLNRHSPSALDNDQLFKLKAEYTAWIERWKGTPEAQGSVFNQVVQLRRRMDEMLLSDHEKVITFHTSRSGVANALEAGATLAGRLAANASRAVEKILFPAKSEAIQYGKVFDRAIKILSGETGGAQVVDLFACIDAAINHGNNEHLHLDRVQVMADIRRRFSKSGNTLCVKIAGSDRSWTAFENAYAANERAMKEFLVPFYSKHGDGVADESLHTTNITTGERVAATRKMIDRGVLGTFPRTFSREFTAIFNSLNRTLKGDGPDSFRAVDAIKDGEKPAEYLARIQKVLTNFEGDPNTGAESLRMIVAPIFTDWNGLDLKTPKSYEEATINVPLPLAKRCYEAALADKKGSVVEETLRRIYREVAPKEDPDNPGSGMTEDQYVEQGYSWFRKKVLTTDALINPVRDIRLEVHATSHVMMDARQVESLPAAWVRYLHASEEDLTSAARTIAKNAALGNNYEKLATYLQHSAQEIQAKAKKWGHMNELEKAAFKKGNPEEADDLKRATEYYKRLGEDGTKLFNEIQRVYQSDASGTEGLGNFEYIFNMTVGLMLTGAKSGLKDPINAINRFATYGLGAAPSILRYYMGLTADVAAATANVPLSYLHLPTINPNARYRDFLARAGLHPSQRMTLRDALSPSFGFEGAEAESRGFRFASVVKGLLSHASLGSHDGAKGPKALVNPKQLIQVHSNCRDAMTDLGNAEVTILNYADHYRKNPDKVGTFIQAKDLHVNEQLYNTFMDHLNSVGIDVRSIAADLVKGKIGDPLEGIDPSAIWTLSIERNTGEATTNSRPLIFNQGKMGRMGMTLLGYQFDATDKFIKMFRDAEGRHTIASFAKGLGVLSVGMAPAAVAYSVLIDQYDEEVLNKRTATRELKVPMTERDFKKSLDAIVQRMGTLGVGGFFGDLAAMTVDSNDGPTGMNTFSLDNRIVAIRQLQSLQKLLGDALASGPENWNYANIGRPALMTMGFGGMLQNMQAANNLTGGMLEKMPIVGGPVEAEANIYQRQNAGNWLRIACKQNDIELRKLSGGSSTLNEASPHVTNMVLAAFANDPNAFMREYKEAIRTYRKMGIQDPRGTVKQAFSSRHILRSIPATTLTIGETQQLLSSMPEQGQAAVREAIQMQNFYGAWLGIEPYYGGTVISKSTLLKHAARASGYGDRVTAWQNDLASNRNGEE